MLGFLQAMFQTGKSTTINTPRDPVHITHVNTRDPVTYSQFYYAALAALERDEANAAPEPPTDPQSTIPQQPPNRLSYRICLDPIYLGTLPNFDPVTLIVKEGDAPLSIGRESTYRSTDIAPDIAFNSNGISRAHAEIWVESGGKLFIRDTGSSSGTFINFFRLSPPSEESRPFQLVDGDVLQFGELYQGGAENVFDKCVSATVEINEEPQATPNVSKYVPLSQLSRPCVDIV
jgi:pSer/pThr/pTyr-binding forkhead associated (FHA) protein